MSTPLVYCGLHTVLHGYNGKRGGEFRSMSQPDKFVKVPQVQDSAAGRLFRSTPQSCVVLSLRTDQGEFSFQIRDDEVRRDLVKCLLDPEEVESP